MSDFRPMAQAERGDVIALWRACGLVRPWNPPDADLDQALAADHAAVLVAADTRVFASVMVGEDGHRAWVYYLAVDPARQGQGWGRRAMAAAEDWARKRGVAKMLLMVRRSNALAEGFYGGLGYDDALTTTYGKWLDPERARIEARHERD